MITLTSFMRKTLAFFIIVSISGCSFFMPKHPNSNFRVDENTKLELLDCKDIQHYRENYQATFPNIQLPTVMNCKSSQATQSVAATVGLMAVNFAISEIQKRIKEESKLYSGQYTGGDYTTNFVSLSNNQTNLNIYGFKLTREVKDGPASEFIFGFAPAGNNSPFILVAPISMQIQKAKAKVLNDDIWTWLPPFIVSKFIAEDSHSIDVEIELKFRKEWVSKDGGDLETGESIMSFSLPGYDLDSTQKLCFKKMSGCDGVLPTFQRKVVVAPPNNVAHLVTVDLLVTEKDSWNTPEKLTWLNTQIDGGKGKIDEALQPKK